METTVLKAAQRSELLKGLKIKNTTEWKGAAYTGKQLRITPKWQNKTILNNRKKIA